MVIPYRVVGMLPKPINYAKIVIRKLRHRDRRSSDGPAKGKAIACPQIQDSYWNQAWAAMTDTGLEDRLECLPGIKSLTN
jgi:hypothetical protein